MLLLRDHGRSRWAGTRSPKGLRCSTTHCTGPVVFGLRSPISYRPRSRRCTTPHLVWRRLTGTRSVCSTTSWHASVELVELNRALAVAEDEGPAAGVAVLEAPALAAELADNHLFHAARGELLARLGETSRAADAFRRAATVAGTTAECRFLEGRLTSLDDREADHRRS